MKGRAETSEEKRAIVERLYAAWLLVPELRLGQLIVNATRNLTQFPGDVFYIEDETLADAVNAHASKRAGR